MTSSGRVQFDGNAGTFGADPTGSADPAAADDWDFFDPLFAAFEQALMGNIVSGAFEVMIAGEFGAEVFNGAHPALIIGCERDDVDYGSGDSLRSDRRGIRG